MSEIKCRAWDSRAKKMYHGIMVHKDFVAQHEVNASGQNIVTIIGSLAGNASYIVPLRYTGFKDIKDDDIFEGDIIVNEIVNLGYVFFEDGCFKVNKVGFYHPTHLYRFGKAIKKLGNIYENPEMLEFSK